MKNLLKYICLKNLLYICDFSWTGNCFRDIQYPMYYINDILTFSGQLKVSISHAGIIHVVINKQTHWPAVLQINLGSYTLEESFSYTFVNVWGRHRKVRLGEFCFD